MKTNKLANYGPQTKAIHGGEPNRRGVNGPIVTEIIRSSTFTFSSTEEMKLWAEGKNKAYIYTLYGNPTLTVAQEKIAALEGAEGAIVTSSGMAAISSALLAALKAGDEVISTAQLYGGSSRRERESSMWRHRRIPRFDLSTFIKRWLSPRNTSWSPSSTTHSLLPFCRIPSPWATTWSCTAPQKHSLATRISSPGPLSATRFGWSASAR